MKWKHIKDKVGREVYTRIQNGGDWSITALVLLDLVAGPAPTEDIRQHKLLPRYAERAWDIIQSWDIRAVSRLRTLFPEYFPRSLAHGQLQAEQDEQGDWVVVTA